MKSKWDTSIAPYIDRIASWMSRGATTAEVAKKLGVAQSTFKKYLAAGRKGDQRYAALADAVQQGCADPDDAVEGAFYRRCIGYQYVETTVDQRLDRNGRPHDLVKRTTKTVPPDVDACKFWLTNRLPDRWGYHPDVSIAVQQAAGGQIAGIVEIPSILPPDDPPGIDATGPPPEGEKGERGEGDDHHG